MDPMTGIIIAIVVGVIVVCFFIVFISRMSKKNKAAHPEMDTTRKFEMHRQKKDG
ncbi:hypothetical protein [Glutamicibacter sp. BW77]|uniref:hypothetical protein n=1 Tax=Glutamicibacter TaxID=1742989 RepID=UPI001142F2D5|nr:hypothetical protein [Glutamicibacter sp. BW77]